MKKNQSVVQGWQAEVAEQYQPANTVRDMYGMCLTNLGGGSYRAESVKGTKLSFSVNPNYIIIGWRSALDFIVIASTSINGNGEIGFVVINEGQNTGTYIPLYNHLDLAFSILNPIYGRFNRESPEIQRYYWWDDKNVPRTINIVDPVYQTYFSPLLGLNPVIPGTQYMVLTGTVTTPAGVYGPNEVLGTVFTADPVTNTFVNAKVIAYIAPDVLALQPSIKVGNIGFKKWLSNGGLYTGTWTYLYCIGDGNAFSPWLYLEKPIHLVASIPGASPDYQLYHGQGPPSYFNTAKGIQIEITGIDTNFSTIRIAAIHSTALDIADPPILVAEETITGSTMTFDHLDPTGLQSLSLDEIIANNITILHNKAGDLNQNYLFIGRPTLRDEPVFDPSLAIVSPCFYELPCDTTDYMLGRHPDDAVPIATMALNGHDANSTDIYVFQWYKVSGPGGGSVTYNAIVYNPGDVFQGVLGVKALSANVGPCILIPILHIQQYTGKYLDIEIIDDFLDHKGMTASTYMKSRWRGETYRDGILLWDLVGNPTYVHWIKDIAMPQQYDTQDDNGNPLAGGDAHILTHSTVVPGERQYSIRVMGIKIDQLNLKEITDNLGIALADLPKYFRGFSIVTAPREATIMGQGLLFPTFGNLDLHPMTATCANADAAPYFNLSGRKENYYAFYSPDFLLRFNNLPNKTESDRLKVVHYLLDEDQATAFRGTVETTGPKYYFKTYMPGSGDARLTPLGVENEINPSNSKEVEVATEDFALTATIKFYNTGGLSAAYGASGGGKGSRTFVVNTKEIESVPLTDFEYGFAVGIDTTYLTPTGSQSTLEDRALVNYIRPRSSLYGGNSASAKANTEYLSNGHFQPFDTDFMIYLTSGGGHTPGMVDDIEIYGGGDCFIGIFDIAKLVIDVTGGGLKASVGYLFPCESNTNFNLREGRHLSAYRTYPNPNGISFGTGVADLPEAFVYNPTYSTNNLSVIFPGLPVILRRNILEHTIYYSLRKQDGELRDNFRIIKQANYQNIDAALGPLTELIVKINKLYYVQNKGVGYLPVNERQTIPGTLGAPLNIGTAGVVPRFDTTNDYYGSNSQSSVFVTEDGFGFFDIRRKTLCLVSTGTIEAVSVLKGIRAYLIDNIVQSTLMNSSPFTGYGISAVYDGQRKHIIMTFKQLTDDQSNPATDFTIIYDLLNKCFAGRHAFASMLYLEHNDKIYSIRDNQNYPFFLENTDYYRYDLIQDVDVVYMCILAYFSGSPAIAPSLDAIHWIKISAIEDVWIHQYGDVGKFYGIVKPSYLSLIFNTPDEENPSPKQIDNFEYQMSQEFWDNVILTNTWQQAQDIAIDIVSNRQYEFRNRLWAATAPQDDNTGKMTDLWCKIMLVKTNLLNQDPTISKNELIKFVSLVTYFELSE